MGFVVLYPWSWLDSERRWQSSLFSWVAPLHCNPQGWGCWTDCVTHRAWRWRHRELHCWAKGTDVTWWLQHLCAVIFLTPVPGRALGSGLLFKNGLWRLLHSPACLPSGPFSVERSRVVRLSSLEEMLLFLRVHSSLLLLPLLCPRWQRSFTINNCMWNLEVKDSERKKTGWRLMGETTVCTSVWSYTDASVLLLTSGNTDHYYNVETHFFFFSQKFWLGLKLWESYSFLLPI